ncbi:MAG: hypothetical protein IIY07_01855, partial [Thermoguttaceae bacterium]|nr:hypothetical protein [Thermoguttaceae bacterium]
MSVLVVPSPVGALLLREDAGKLAEVAFLSPTFSPETSFEQELAAANFNASTIAVARLNADDATPPILRRAAAQLAEYFAGTRPRFD